MTEYRDLIYDVLARICGPSGPDVDRLLLQAHVNRYGFSPPATELKKMAAAVEDAWELTYNHPYSRGFSHGCGTPYYPRDGDPSPWQENAVRAMEDG